MDAGITMWSRPFTWPMNLTKDFKFNFLNSRISGMRALTDMEWRDVSLSTWSRTHIVTFNFDHNNKLDLGFSRWNFEEAVLQETWHPCPTYGGYVGSFCYVRFCNLCSPPWLTKSGVPWYVYSVGYLLVTSKGVVFDFGLKRSVATSCDE